MIHPAFEWIDEGMDFSDVLPAIGFKWQLVTADLESEQDWVALEALDPEQWLAGWQPEGEGTLIAKYISDSGEPVAIFATPETELAAVLLAWRPGKLAQWLAALELLEEAAETLGPAYDPAGAEMLRARILDLLAPGAELVGFGDQYRLPGLEMGG